MFQDEEPVAQPPGLRQTMGDVQRCHAREPLHRAQQADVAFQPIILGLEF